MHQNRVIVLLLCILTLVLFLCASYLWQSKHVERRAPMRINALSACLASANASDACWSMHRRHPMLRAMRQAQGNIHQAARYVVPTVHCDPLELRRIGNRGDGGKWMCGAPSANPCVIFSFGSNGDFSFETAILSDVALQHCRVVVFDCFWPRAQIPPGIVFDDTCIAKSRKTDAQGRRFDTLPHLMKKHNVTHLSYLKFDIEGAEYDMVASLRTMPLSTLPPQLSFEVHFQWSGAASARDALHILLDLDAMGYRTALVERNPGCDDCKEIVMVRN